MKKKIIIVSGRICTWKSALAQRIADEYGFELIKTSDILRKMSSSQLTRSELQEYGDRLDVSTNFRWVHDAVVSATKSETAPDTFILDHVRHKGQLEYFRSQSDLDVTHIHLFAQNWFLEAEFKIRQRKSPETVSGTWFEADPLFGQQEDIVEFMQDADIRLDVTRNDAEDVFVRATAAMRITPIQRRQCVDVVIGGQFGSEGKGNIAAYLSKEYDVLVRVGGPNAGHTVSSETGEYTYHQLPSGSKDCQAEILLGPGMTIDVEGLLKEIDDCNIDEQRLFIDPNAMIIAADDKVAEMNLKEEISSTGSGSGSAAARRILGRSRTTKLARDVVELSPYVGKGPNPRGSTLKRLELAYARNAAILLEGTQGSGLSLYHGEYPYVTSRDTNVAGCIAEAGISPARVRRIILVTRSTPIRVADPIGDGQTSGHLKHETSFHEIAEVAGLDGDTLKKAEITSTTRRDRRVGWFDWELFRRSCKLNAPTDIALTFADYIDRENQDARRYERLSEGTIQFIEELELVSQARVTLVNTRFPKPRQHSSADLRCVIDRRSWRGGR